MATSYTLSNYRCSVSEISNPEVKTLCEYFRDRAPTTDSASAAIIDSNSYESVYQEMMVCCKIQNHFEKAKASNKTVLEKYDLLGNQISLKPKRVMCKLKDDNETNLQCLLRHIRNSCAHGYVHIIENKRVTYIIFDDYRKKPKRTDNPTARIIVNKTDLKKWKTILERATKEYHKQELKG